MGNRGNCLPDACVLLLRDTLSFLISSTTVSLDQRIEQTDGICGGKSRIAGHRITVRDVVVWHERQGWSVDQIASEYDLSLADVYAALAYYFSHREEIDRSLEASRAFIEKIKTEQSAEQADPLAEDG
nr:DUF433 domain-containing protein [Salinibacter ruber]